MGHGLSPPKASRTQLVAWLVSLTVVVALGTVGSDAVVGAPSVRPQDGAQEPPLPRGRWRDGLSPLAAGAQTAPHAASVPQAQQRVAEQQGRPVAEAKVTPEPSTGLSQTRRKCDLLTA